MVHVGFPFSDISKRFYSLCQSHRRHVLGSQPSVTFNVCVLRHTLTTRPDCQPGLVYRVQCHVETWFQGVHLFSVTSHGQAPLPAQSFCHYPSISQPSALAFIQPWQWRRPQRHMGHFSRVAFLLTTCPLSMFYGKFGQAEEELCPLAARVVGLDT